MFYQATSKVRFGGLLGERLKANKDKWLKSAPLANPGMSEMFLRGDLKPHEKLVPWYGEFPGKYITCAAVAYAMDPDSELEQIVEDLIERLASVQDENGFLSPHRKGEWLTGCSKWDDPEVMIPLWELWGYYHLIYGLMCWYEITGSLRALSLARSSADAVVEYFLKAPEKIDLAKANENLGLAHGYALLYKTFGCERYREMAELILARAERERRYTEGALTGKAFYELPWPRWEALHALEGLGAMGDEKREKAMQLLAESIRVSDRHNTGAFSSGEGACGDPYNQGAVETCCSVAWMALMIDCLKKTEDAKWADELELTFINEALASQHPTGRWWTYDTPQNGVRRASAHSIVFQAVQGSPELNCCSVNGPRMLGMTGEWGLYSDANMITVNYYGESRWESRLASGVKVILTQHTAYPADPVIVIDVAPSERAVFAVKLRIPAWSENTKVQLDGECFTAEPGEYLTIEREWQGGEKIEIEMDFSLHAWCGQGEVEGLHALYRGPVLLTLDQRFNAIDFTDLPAVAPNALEKIESKENWFKPMFMLKDKASGMVLCDFATAGATGTRYASWLKLTDDIRRSSYQPD